MKPGNYSLGSIDILIVFLDMKKSFIKLLTLILALGINTLKFLVKKKSLFLIQSLDV